MILRLHESAVFIFIAAALGWLFIKKV